MPNVTPAGKELEIVNLSGYNLFKIQFTSGGQLPDYMSGTYTKKEYAQKDIDTYLASKEKKSPSAKKQTNTVVK